jgi:membrane-bound metal-dependent hydrolase YbcI (DUF457 family)
MMGSTHAQSGMLAWSFFTTAAAPVAGIHLPWFAVAAGTLACAGAALLPDADHPSASIAQSFGPLSEVATRLVHRVSGGHRQATHSLLLAAATYGGSLAAVRAGHGFAALPMMFVLFVFAIRALHIAPGLTYGVAALADLLAFLLMRGNYAWLPTAIGVGYLAHLVGDCLTMEGCPLWWPFEVVVRLPLIRRTGNKIEMRLFGPAFALGTFALFVFVH